MADRLLLARESFRDYTPSSDESACTPPPPLALQVEDNDKGSSSESNGDGALQPPVERHLVFTPPGTDFSETRAIDSMEMHTLDGSFGSEHTSSTNASAQQPRRESNYSRVTEVSASSHDPSAFPASISLLSRLGNSGRGEFKGLAGPKRGPSILAPKRKPRGSVAEGGFEGPFDAAFWEKVTEKQTLEGLIKKVAIREARLDNIVEKSGSAEEAVMNIVENANSQGEARHLLDGLIARGVDLGCRDEPYLHVVAERNFVYVARTLMDNEVAPDGCNDKGELPVVIALRAGHDEMASIIMRKMNKKSVRSLFDPQEDGGNFFYQDLVTAGNMPMTCRAVLDACVNATDEPDEYRFFYRILESDSDGLAPNDAGFNVNGKTSFHRVLECKDKELQRHNVVRMLIYNKWVEYGERMAILNLGLYLLFMLCVTFSLISAGRQADPREYDSAEDYARGVLEVISLLGVMVNLYDEAKECYREKTAYVTDGNNYLQVGSILLILAIVPLRWLDQDAQWHVACFAYIFVCLRILQLISVTRMVGIYLQILTRILYKDISRFVIIFGIFLLTYAGSLFLALRGEPVVERNSTSDPKETTELGLNHFTSNYGFILVTGLRTMIQQESIVDYLNDDTPSESFSWLGIVINMLFLFFVLVVLLNILIAQLSDTYADVKADAQRELEQNWAASLRNLEQGTSPLKKYRFRNYDDFEDVTNPEKRLVGWEEPKDVDEDEEVKRRQQQMESDIEKQSQQIMALKAQMRATLELLHENRKMPPKLDSSIAHLGSVQVPQALTAIVGRTEEVLRDDVMETRHQQQAIFRDLQTAADGHTTALRQSLDEQTRGTRDLVNGAHADTSAELDSIKQSVAVSIPERLQSVTAAAHQETVAVLGDRIGDNSQRLQALDAYVQTELRAGIDAVVKASELAVIGDATAAVTALREQESEHSLQLRQALDASERRLTATLATAIAENGGRVQADLTRQLEASTTARQQALEQQLQSQVEKIMAEVNRLLDGAA
uniref:Transient receptor potential A n=1 Tax=Sycon coactum TaxID=1009717 RepID=A0A0A9ZGA8_9METZ